MRSKGATRELWAFASFCGACQEKPAWVHASDAKGGVWACGVRSEMLLLAGRDTSRGVCLWGIVTGTGADREFGVTATRKGIDADGTKGSVFS